MPIECSGASPLGNCTAIRCASTQVNGRTIAVLETPGELPVLGPGPGQGPGAGPGPGPGPDPGPGPGPGPGPAFDRSAMKLESEPPAQSSTRQVGVVAAIMN